MEAGEKPRGNYTDTLKPMFSTRKNSPLLIPNWLFWGKSKGQEQPLQPEEVEGPLTPPWLAA